MSRNFAHLHVHNEFSFLDGVGTAKQWAERAKALGMEHMALTNHGNIDGVIRWQSACKEVGINGIIGVEAYIVPDLHFKPPKGTRDKRHHITLLAKNAVGFRNLMKLMTVANVDGIFKGAWGREFPRIDPGALLDHCEGIVVLTGCQQTFIGMEDNRFAEIAEATDIYLEVMPVLTEGQKKLNPILVDLARDTGLKLVATNDCHYPKQGDELLQEVLLALQSKSKWSDPKRWRFDIDGLHLRSRDEMVLAFMRQGVLDKATIHKALDNTIEVAEKCVYYQEQIPVILPDIDIPEFKGKSSEEQLVLLSLRGLAGKATKHLYIADKRAEYDDRLEEELIQICTLGFAKYFLIVWELIDWCENNDIMCGPGRGSVGGSLVAYVLGITKVDPLLYGLVFTRFISPARIDLPDIDMDFEDRKRGMIRKHLEDLYGVDNVCALSNYQQLHGRGALRDIGRCFELPPKDVDKAAKSIVVRSTGDLRDSFTIEDSFMSFEDGKQFYDKYPNEAKIAMKLEGQIKAAGKHAAAMCVVRDPIPSGKNCSYVNRKDELLANWDKHDAEHMGLMKLDVLGLNQLTILAEARKLIKERHGVEIDYESLSLSDEAVLAEFNAGNNIGCFQLNSLGMMRICQQIGIDSFKEVAAVNALHRPGCLRSGMVLEYQLRKNGEQEVEKIHPFLDKITEDTYGIVLYQEQVMLIMYELAGLPWRTADGIRKVISKKQGEEQFNTHKKEFIDGCLANNTLNEDQAGLVFDQIKFFGNYGFNKSHAVEYALMTYWDMWLKVHYPNEFVESLLSWDTNSERKNEYINEARRLGIKITLPNINRSLESVWTSDHLGRLVIPFTEIKGLGEKAAACIVKERNDNGPFKDLEDLERRIEKRKVNKRVREVLVAVRAFEEIDHDLPEPELDALSEFFTFSLSNDPAFRYRKCLERLSEHVDIMNIEDIDWDMIDKEHKLFFGKMSVLRFGYREKVVKRTAYDVKGTSSEMGGVYGNIVDDTDYAMIVFANELYKERKDDIEHSEGRWLMARANHPWRPSSIRASDIWFGEQLLEGDLGGLDISMAQPPADPELFEYLCNEMRSCRACGLRDECTQVVPPNIGLINASIIAEAPGWKEDSLGIGLAGRSGELAWEILSNLGITREMLHISNVNKCYPKISKTPKSKNIKACSHWLDAELRAIRPFVVLACGNKVREFFTGEQSGIMDVSGSTTWNDEYQCWICWSIHPAAALRRGADHVGEVANTTMKDLEAAFKNFANKLAVLG